MTSLPRFLSEDEKTIVLTALEPHLVQTFNFSGAGSFSKFARLNDEVRGAINRALGEYRGSMWSYRYYAIPVDDSGAHDFVLAFSADNTNVCTVLLDEPIDGYLTGLAKKATEPWSLWGELRALGIKDIFAIILLISVGWGGYYIDHLKIALVFFVLGLIGLLRTFLWSPFAHYRHGVKVGRALLALEEARSAKPPRSSEDIIRSRGDTIGPQTTDSPQPA